MLHPLDRALAPLVAAVLVAAALAAPALLATSTAQQDDETREVDRAAAAGKTWKTMKTYKRGKLQACRPPSRNGFAHLVLRMDNQHRRGDRRAEIWSKDAAAGRTWTAAAHSGWIRSGRTKMFVRLSSTGDLAQQKVRVRMRAPGRAKRLTYFSWARVPTC